MGTDQRPEPMIFVIFGGAGHRHATDKEFRRHLREGVDTFSRRGQTTDGARKTSPAAGSPWCSHDPGLS